MNYSGKSSYQNHKLTINFVTHLETSIDSLKIEIFTISDSFILIHNVCCLCITRKKNRAVIKPLYKIIF